MNTSKPDDAQGKTRKLFIAAFIFALLAGLGTIIYLNVLERRLKARLTPPEKQMVHVVVASRDLPAGSVVNTSTMSVRPVPKSYVNSDIFTPSQFDSIQGAILIKPLQHGKMLAQDYIDLKIPKDFSGTIQSGHRAVTIQVDELNSISGMIRPGNFIDLFTRLSSSSLPSAGSAKGGDVVIPVLVDVLVLATDKISARPNEDEYKNLNNRERGRTYNTMTLEVTPKEAALIAIAESRGELIAALRNTADTGGILFNKIGIADLVAHSGAMLEAATSKQQNRKLSGVHLNGKGQLVTKDGIVIKAPGVHLDKNGLLVTKNGTLLSGRNLMVGDDGRIRTRDGKPVDTSTLVAGKDGTLIDGDGTVLASNGYGTAKGGFLIDKNGNVMTAGGDILKGLSVGKDGQVRTKDGRIVTADEIRIGKDGKVRLVPPASSGLHIAKDGSLQTTDGKTVLPRDLITVDKNGVVRGKNGRILKGVTVGKDGQLRTKDGRIVTADEIRIGKDGKVRLVPPASSGLHIAKDGSLQTTDGKTVLPRDLITVDKNGVVRGKNGRILKGVTVGKDGALYDAAGKKMSAKEVLLASDGFTKNADGSVTDAAGRVYNAKQLVSVGKDGTVRTKDGLLLTGVHVDKDGKLRDKNGKLLTAADIVERSELAKTQAANAQTKGRLLAGVTAVPAPDFIKSIRSHQPATLQEYVPYEVEYIVGGNSDGSAKTFTVQVDMQQKHTPSPKRQTP